MMNWKPCDRCNDPVDCASWESCHNKAPESQKKAKHNTAIGFALAAALAMSTPIDSAQAQGVVTCGFETGITCLFGSTNGGLGKVIEVSPPRNVDELLAQRERIRAWEARCKPVIVFDNLGVGRYSYAAPGCEFGR